MSIQNILDGDRTEVMTINPPDAVASKEYSNVT
jgi:hypothetical protein